MTTLLDVARRAGVSKSTVSNVIRGAALVAESTRLRVERAIADTGYHPNAIARALKARTSKAIGIVVPDLTNLFYAGLAVGVERAANALGYAVLATHTECSAATEAETGRALIERQVDGVVIGGMSLGSTLPTVLLDRGIPVVLASLGSPTICASAPSIMTTRWRWRRSSRISTSSATGALPSWHRSCRNSRGAPAPRLHRGARPPRP